MSRNGLDQPHAARVLAMMAIAIADAEIDAWDGKHTYWPARPITIDPDLDVQFPLALATEAAASRAWSGIHFPIDNDAGLLLGRNVGYLVTNVAREDGAESFTAIATGLSRR